LRTAAVASAWRAAGVEIAEQERDLFGRVVSVGRAERVWVNPKVLDIVRIVLLVLLFFLLLGFIIDRRRWAGAHEGFAAERMLEIVDRHPRDRVSHLLVKL